jgi:hypothetical protein
MATFVPPTFTPDLPLGDLCRKLADRAGVPFACLHLSEVAHALLGDQGNLCFPRTVDAGRMTVTARAPVPSRRGSPWGEAILGNSMAHDLDDGARRLLAVFADEVGRLLDQGAGVA